MVKLSEIKDLLPCPIMSHDPRLCLPEDDRKHNRLLWEIGNCSIELDLKETAIILHGLCSNYPEWIFLSEKEKLSWINKAQALNASLGSLIRVKTE